MTMQSSRSLYFIHGCNVLLILLFHSISFELASCGNIVHSLPGFQGPLPFVLETGYVGVGEGEDVQAFYYFIESENNPEEDPLMLWLSGGPGCSSLSGLMNEIGPFTIKKEEYNGSLPNLVLKPHSWTKVSNIIFLDLPVFAGFTYPRTEFVAQRSDSSVVHQAHQFLRKWLLDHPKFLSNKVYIGGDSYSGITVPVIVQEISQGNENKVQPWINLQGYLLGNPLTTTGDQNFAIPFAHGMGIISDELYESLQKSCEGEYIHVNTSNKLCSRDMDLFKKLTSRIYADNVLDPFCETRDDLDVDEKTIIKKYPSKFLKTHLNLPAFSSRLTSKVFMDYILDPFCEWQDEEVDDPSKFLKTHLKLPAFSCRTYIYFLCHYWANDDNVRKALNVHKGSIGEWYRCAFSELHKFDIPSSYEYHVNLSKKGYRSLIYSGDHDMTIPFIATQAWIKSLNYSIVEDWRPWLVNDQVAGYTRTYSNRMTFATVRGGGHTAPQYKPEECFAMYSRWLSNKTL